MTIFRNVIVSNLLLIVAYYISAHFTLSLSLPPNGVTPLWVPAGIAMGAILVWGYRLLPAVFIGDFVIGVELVGLQDTTSFFICILFGLQAAVHAGMGLWLLKKFSIWPDRLIRDTNIFKFFLLTAVIPIFIPTLVFILIELMIGIIPVEQFLSTLFMWWGGGVMGVVLFTPLVLIFFAEPKKHWRTRFLLVALPL
ncbi:MAG: MASE1 domain-containing protein, partial [Gammaproteobacteria bacterium]|nr:MASE1 domain-containing protein [Gammaproteobacteria bacterium]